MECNRKLIQFAPLNTCDINDILFFLTHFNASDCHLRSEHLEELAFACLNLQELNLEHNINCLKSLKGLHIIASSCKHLRGLNLSCVSFEDVENPIQLWEILAKLRLVYLAIDLCILLPHVVSEQDMEAIVNLQQQCIDLKALEVENWCDQCEIVCKHGADFLLFGNFTSLVQLYASTHHHPTSMKDILSSCKARCTQVFC